MCVLQISDSSALWSPFPTRQNSEERGLGTEGKGFLVKISSNGSRHLHEVMFRLSGFTKNLNN